MDSITTSRLEIIAAKARILADKAKANQFWEGELERDLAEIEDEICLIKTGCRGYSHSRDSWSPDNR